MKILSFLLVWAAFIPATDAAPKFESVEAAGEFMSTYYKSPEPDAIEALIRVLGKNEQIEGNGGPAVAGFLAEVAHANPERVENWVAVANTMDEGAAAVLIAGLESGKNIDKIRSMLDVGPSYNDLRWGGFMASGEPIYVHNQIRMLGYYASNDFNELATAFTAKWSLCSNARQHDLVREIVAKALQEAEEPFRSHLNDVLTMSPGEIRQQTIAMLKSRKEELEASKPTAPTE